MVHTTPVRGRSFFSRPNSYWGGLWYRITWGSFSSILTDSQGKNVVSVKGGCIEGLDWKKAIHIWTRSAMVPIPEGSESYSEESTQSDYAGTQEELDQGSSTASSAPYDSADGLRGSGGPGDPEKPIHGACELSG